MWCGLLTLCEVEDAYKDAYKVEEDTKKKIDTKTNVWCGDKDTIKQTIVIQHRYRL